jgi:hypothetical protein
MWYFEVVPKSGGILDCRQKLRPPRQSNIVSLLPVPGRSGPARYRLLFFALAGFGLRVVGWPAPQNLTEENFYDAT